MTDVRVRAERPADVDRVREINDLAFGPTSESARHGRGASMPIERADSKPNLARFPPAFPDSQ